MKPYRVYQNLSQFAITVEANNKKEAIEKATRVELFGEWDHYDENEDNIFYEAICLKPKK